MKLCINTFSLDNVILMGPEYTGLKPSSKNDIIIAEYSISDKNKIEGVLSSMGIKNKVLYCPLTKEMITDKSIFLHKVNVISNILEDDNFYHGYHVDADIDHVRLLNDTLDKVCLIHLSKNF